MSLVIFAAGVAVGLGTMFVYESVADGDGTTVAVHAESQTYTLADGDTALRREAHTRCVTSEEGGTRTSSARGFLADVTR